MLKNLLNRINSNMSFSQKLKDVWQANNSLVSVGLDPDIEKIPLHLKGQAAPLFRFNKEIIEATADLVCAYKPQIAHYSAAGTEEELKMTIDFIHRVYPHIPVILDAKRGDIGSTAEHYAIEAFERFGADAVTVNPYLGQDALQPFLDRADKGVIILCRTSNPSAVDLQDQKIDGHKLYEIVAHKASSEWNKNNNVLLVVGATYPEELKKIRAIVGDMTLLIPGVGAQGGDIQAAVTAGKNNDGTGIIIHSSRSIIYASGDENFAQAARDATIKLKEEINKYR